MRVSMRPVTISRVVETLWYAADHSPFSPNDLAGYLKASQNRGKEIAEEMANMQLLNKNVDSFSITNKGQSLIDAVQEQNWDKIHSLMMDYPFYREFNQFLKENGPHTKEAALTFLINSPVHFNAATIQVLCDWGERLGIIQRNVFSGQYYTVKPFTDNFIPCFLSAYQELNIHLGPLMQKHYIEIPILRESMCEKWRISRHEFDKMLIDAYGKNIGKLELSGAPITTHARISSKKVKSTIVTKMPERLVVTLSSEEFLNGVSIRGKSYYSIAYHGGDLCE